MPRPLKSSIVHFFFKDSPTLSFPDSFPHILFPLYSQDCSTHLHSPLIASISSPNNMSQQHSSFFQSISDNHFKPNVISELYNKCPCREQKGILKYTYWNKHEEFWVLLKPFFEYFLVFRNSTFFQSYLVLCLSKSWNQLFFQVALIPWRMVFRSQDLDTRWAHGNWDVTVPWSFL